MKFVGGSLDGATIEVKGWVTPFFYAQSNITAEEAEALHIDENIRWKAPEDVYERTDKT